jgi:hypothetical protein
MNLELTAVSASSGQGRNLGGREHHIQLEKVTKVQVEKQKAKHMLGIDEDNERDRTRGGRQELEVKARV